MKVVGGEIGFVGELLELFFEAYPGQLEQLQQAIKTSDNQLLRDAAHAIKGAAGNIRAKGSARAAWQLEKMGQDGNLAGAAAALEALQNEIEQLRLAAKALTSVAAAS